MNLTNEAIENGFLSAAPELFGTLVKDLKTKYDLARIGKKLVKEVTEPMEARSDLIRIHFPTITTKQDFDGNGNPRTDHFVEPETLTEEKRKEWEAAIKAWRETAFHWVREDVLKIKIEKSLIAKIPQAFLAATMDVIEIEEIEDLKSTALEEVGKISAKLDEIKKGLKKD